MLPTETMMRHFLTWLGIVFVTVAACSVSSELSSFPDNVYSTSCLDKNGTLPADAKLCASSLTYKLLDSKAGLVEFSLLLPFNEPNASTDVTILSLESTPEGEKCSSVLDGIHSKFTVSLSGSDVKSVAYNASPAVSCSPHQVKKVEWKSNYMFTGCYRIDISLNYDCTSKPFRIESNFKKDTFAELGPKMVPKFSGNDVRIVVGSALLKNDCNNPKINSSCLLLSLYKSSYDGHSSSELMREHVVYASYPLEKNLEDGYYVRHCQWFKQEHDELVNCSCTWYEGSLECTFFDVSPGNYSLELDIMDTRCIRGTIWTKGWEDKDVEPCLWKHDFTVNNNTQNQYPFEAPFAAFPSISYPWLMLVIVVTSTAIGLSVYMRWRRRPLPPLIRESMQDIRGEEEEVIAKLLEPPKVLLLYARDCDPFMAAMAQLRRLLRDNISAQVYDIWEDRTQEEIETQGDIWTSPFIHAENVKVIVVASPISRSIEESLMNGIDVRYELSVARDETFLFAFQTAIGLAPKTKEPCNKFVVVRLNHRNCSDDVLKSFSTNCTVYTLPTHLQKLIFHLLQSQSVNVTLDLKNPELLSDQIEVYDKFVSSHRTYINEMLECPERDK